ncbi:3-dehydroquinate synthase [Parvularcula dongshanensis]|uniref:3-dehydroquinate synthase n=1 Tax=Parvularcula dongshanensis TaxID=1173995 RepID=A0A840I576_9PROT|nr:3-dehydroquinate synthase [Parvularcula dongshanensis]MBB4659354.1 3-dehydroquinate synthase [Parvularcula dongshanensis]
MREVRVELGERAYDILIGPGALPASEGRLRAAIGRGRAAIVADEAVWALHRDVVTAVLGDLPIVTVPSGEATKSWSEYARVSEALLAADVGRDGTVIALGGGVTGDLAGFCAGTLRRGCNLIQLPTTLLSQVDSSVGGKTGINSRQGKNLVGVFHQPSLVVIDTALLDTLPDREMRAGYAEVVKYALLGDAPFASWLEAHGGDVLRRAPAALAEAIETSCRAKARIVAEDEREGGRRALLNLGHTFGHAIEAAYGYDGRVLHGEGVAVGMAMAYRYAEAQGICDGAEAERAVALIAGGGLPTTLGELPAEPLTADGLLTAMYQDKKVEGGALTLILPRAVGDSYVAKSVAGDTVRAFLAQELAEA